MPAAQVDDAVRGLGAGDEDLDVGHAGQLPQQGCRVGGQVADRTRRPRHVGVGPVGGVAALFHFLAQRLDALPDFRQVDAGGLGPGPAVQRERGDRQRGEEQQHSAACGLAHGRHQTPASQPRAT
jgi:hypothetical protein